MPHSDAASRKHIHIKQHWLYLLDAASECGMTITDSLAYNRMYA